MELWKYNMIHNMISTPYNYAVSRFQCVYYLGLVFDDDAYNTRGDAPFNVHTSSMYRAVKRLLEQIITKVSDKHNKYKLLLSIL